MAAAVAAPYQDHQYLPHHRPEHHHFPPEHYHHPPQSQPQPQPQGLPPQQQYQPQRQLSMASVPLTIVEDMLLEENDDGPQQAQAQAQAQQPNDDVMVTTIDSVTIIDVHDDNLEYRRVEQQEAFFVSGQRPLMAHGRMNSQLTMISALTDADNYLLARVPHSGRESDQLSQSAGGNYEDDDDFVIAEDVEGETSASVPATAAAIAAATAMDGEQASSPLAESQLQPPVGTMPMVDKTDNNSVDYNDLESFIIEDNDEGENSLSASPFLPHRLGGGGHGAITTTESTPLSQQAVASDGRFTHPLPTPTATTTTGNNIGVGGVASTATSSTGAVLVAPPTATGAGGATTTTVPPAVASAEDLLRLQLFREFARDRISFSDILLHEITTRPYWWPEYIADEMAHRQRRAWSMDPDTANDPSLKAVQEWMHEPISCILTHLPTTTSSTME